MGRSVVEEKETIGFGQSEFSQDHVTLDRKHVCLHECIHQVRREESIGVVPRHSNAQTERADEDLEGGVAAEAMEAVRKVGRPHALTHVELESVADAGSTVLSAAEYIAQA
jgi:hypothetical protein